MPRLHIETHLVERIGWLRAAVLGANDGIISTASLILGVAAAAAAKGDIMLAGVAGLVAGAMSMAAGEYVSVSSQSDTEQADLAKERRELAEAPEFEQQELAQIYVPEASRHFRSCSLDAWLAAIERVMERLRATPHHPQRGCNPFMSKLPCLSLS
jgi:cobalamin biosynthesis protein CbiD